MKITNEVWNKRSLIWEFAISDLKIRYRNSILGFFWNFLEPLLMLTVLYVVFTNIFETEIEFFPLYLLLGLIIWNMFVRGTQISLNSAQSKSNILTQVYIPLEILPISAALTSFMMLSFEIIVLSIFFAVFQLIPPITIIILPLLIILEFVLVLGISFPLSVLNVRYKDVQFIWGVILQVGFFATPIFYKLDILPEKIQTILMFSPIVQIMNISRDVALYGILPNMIQIIIVISTTSLILIIGYGVFRKMKNMLIEEL